MRTGAVIFEEKLMIKKGFLDAHGKPNERTPKDYLCYLDDRSIVKDEGSNCKANSDKKNNIESEARSST